MIILEGPDGSGKSILAKQLMVEAEGRLKLIHNVAATEYNEYMEFLAGEPSKPVPINAAEPFIAGSALQAGAHFIQDRTFWSELPYSTVFRSAGMKFSTKQFHNMHLLTLSHNPVVVLMTRNSGRADSTVPPEFFNPILASYRWWFKELDIAFFEWDYLNPPMPIENLVAHSFRMQQQVVWWRNLYKKGLGGIGNTANPTVLILAEEIGPNNLYRLPFERGSSGFYLSEVLDEADTPLSEFYLTNWRKTIDEKENARLLLHEIDMTGVSHIIFMGRTAQGAEKYLHQAGHDLKVYTMPHPGWIVNHSPTIKEMEKRKRDFLEQWKTAWTTAMKGPESHIIPEEETVYVA